MLIAPAAPGGGWDQLARTMQRVLERTRIERRVSVENIPGAAGTIGLARFVSQHAGDERALLVSGLVMVGGVVQNDSPVGVTDASPLARLVGEYEAIAVPASSPFKSLGDLIAQWRAEPGSVVFGGGSAGGTDQMLVELLARQVGVDLTRVNYVPFAGGGEARAALLGAQVSAGVSGVGEFTELVASGGVRLLAVSSPQRIAQWDVPTLREAGISLDVANWRGLLAPPGLTRRERDALEALVDRMVQSAEWRAALRERGWDDLYQRREAFTHFVAEEDRRVRALAATRGGKARGSGTATRYLPLVLFALFVWSAWRSLGGRPRVAVTGAAWRRAGLMVAALLFAGAGLRMGGFVVAGAVAFAGAAIAHGERRYGRVALVAVGFAAITFALFRFGLGVQLPIGTIFGVGR